MYSFFFGLFLCVFMYVRARWVLKDIVRIIVSVVVLYVYAFCVYALFYFTLWITCVNVHVFKRDCASYANCMCLSMRFYLWVYPSIDVFLCSWMSVYLCIWRIFCASLYVIYCHYKRIFSTMLMCLYIYMHTRRGITYMFACG